MSNIFDIELQFQSLKTKLGTTSSTKFKLKLITKFLCNLLKEEEQNKFISYYIDLVPSLYYLIEKNDFKYLSPEEIDSMIVCVNQIREIEFLKEQGIEFKRMHYMLCNAKENMLLLLGEKETDGTDLTTCTEVMSESSIPVVLIEKNDEIYVHDDTCGLIHTLNLDITPISHAESDKIEFRNLVDIDDSEIVEYLKQIVKLVKTKLSNNKKKEQFYYFSFYFDEKEYIYSGTSIGAAAILLTYNAIQINEFKKYYYKFRVDTVLTSEVDEAGNLVKLDSGSLKSKLQTVFFSEYKKFVIPFENLNEAEKELEILNSKYPKRKLQLIPVKNYENILRNLDIVERFELKFHQKLSAYLRNYHKAVILTSFLITFLFVVYYIVYYFIPHLDNDPFSYSLEDKTLVIKNKYQIILYQSPVLDASAIYELTNGGYKSNRVIIEDINKDNQKEVLYIERSDSNTLKNRSVYCINSDGSLKWTYSVPQKTVQYDTTHEDNLLLNEIFILPAKDNKCKILYHGRLNDMFPYTLGVIDCFGKQISEYWNSGFLNIVKIYDLDDDGVVEVLAGGSNNLKLWNCAALVVFDKDVIEGNSPDTNPLNDNKIGLQKYYVLFPRTIILENTRKPRNNVDQIKRFNDKISVWVLESNEPPASVNYIFDPQMNLVDVQTSDDFDLFAKQLVADNKIEPFDIKQYCNSLKTKVLWWDGEKFVNFPAINSNYVKAKKE